MKMDMHKQFLAFTQQVLSAGEDPTAPDLHAILAGLAEGEDVYDLMAGIPDDQISRVLTWVMNVDLPDEDA